MLALSLAWFEKILKIVHQMGETASQFGSFTHSLSWWLPPSECCFFSSSLLSCDTKSFWLAFDIYWCLCVTNVRCVSAVWNYYRFRWPAVKFVLWLQSFRCRDERLKLRVRGDSCIHTHTHVKPIRAASHQMRPHVCLHAIKWLNIICGVLVC